MAQHVNRCLGLLQDHVAQQRLGVPFRHCLHKHRLVEDGAKTLNFYFHWRTGFAAHDFPVGQQEFDSR